MTRQLFSVRDMVAEAFHAPFVSQNTATAMRSLKAQAETDAHLKAHSLDFILFRVGAFDDSTGMIAPELSPVRVCSVAELISAKTE